MFTAHWPALVHTPAQGCAQHTMDSPSSYLQPPSSPLYLLLLTVAPRDRPGRAAPHFPLEKLQPRGAVTCLKDSVPSHLPTLLRARSPPPPSPGLDPWAQLFPLLLPYEPLTPSHDSSSSTFLGAVQKSLATDDTSLMDQPFHIPNCSRQCDSSPAVRHWEGHLTSLSLTFL